MKYNKKILALFFLGIYLFSATASREFMKLPVLVEHYFDHVGENDVAGFYQYLVLHYYTEDGTDQDAAEDSRLPFKSPEHNSIFFTSLKPPIPVSAENAWMNITIGQCNHTKENLPSQYLNAIWQPPRPGSFL